MTESRKISKVIYLLIEKYHRLFGLEVYGFSGGHGPGYAGFQVAGRRCWKTGKAEPGYGKLLNKDSRLVLVTYFTSVGIPAWCAGNQLELEDWGRQRTSTIVDWLEKHLTLLELFDLYKSDIARWRARYTVEESEKYLLMVNLAGLISARFGGFPRTPEQLFHGMDPEGIEKAEMIISRLGVSDGTTDAFGVPGCVIGRNGQALVEGDSLVDIWKWHVDGAHVEEMAEELISKMRAP
jgi:hypothetical protein